MVTMHSLFLWFTVSRPLLYPLIPLIIILGYQSSGQSVAEAPLSLWMVLTLVTWPLSVVVYGLNDIFDTKSDTHNQYRERLAGETVQISNRYIVQRAVAVGTFILFGSVFLIPFQAWVILIGLVLGAVVYSVPPLRLKERLCCDMFFSGFTYIVVPYLIGGSLAGSMMLPAHIVVLALVASLYHLLAAVRDIEADTLAGFRTTATVLGRPVALGMIIIASVILLVWWWVLRPDDYPSFVLISTLTSVGVYAAWVGSYRAVMYAVNVFSIAACLVGIYKVLF